MNEQEKVQIRSAFSDLILHTNCSADFLTFFETKKTLTLADIENIAAKNAGTSRAAEFYKIIQTRTNAFPILLEGLKKYKQVKALQILTGNIKEKVVLSEEELRPRVKKLLGDTLVHSGISFDVSPPVHLFTGRSKELLELHEMVQQSKEGNRITVISQLTTVTGLGGIGKTQLARQYIQQRREEFDENVIWLNAESPPILSESFRRLATQKLNLSTRDSNGKEKSGKAVAADIYKYFEGSRALFVLDNADNSGTGLATPLPSSWLFDFLPNPQRNPDLYTIITSRNTEWGIGMKIIKLDALTDDEAKAMIKFGLDINQADNSQDDAIITLAKTLQNFPLALHQAICYIYEQNLTEDYSVQDYISEFNSTKEEVMLSYQDSNSLDDTYMLTTSTTWKITVDKIATQSDVGLLATRLLKIMSYYDPSNIHREIFYEPFHKLFNNSQVEQLTMEESTNIIKASIRLLVKYSMINSGPYQSVLNIHRLVQAVTRNQEENTGENIAFFYAINCIIDFYNKDVFNVKQVEHGISVWRHSWNRPGNSKTVLSLFNIVSKEMFLRGRIEEGISFCNEALKKYKEVFGDESQFCFRVQEMLAMMLELKESGMGIKLLTELLNKVKLLFGTESGIFKSIKSTLKMVQKALSKDPGMDLPAMKKEFEAKKADSGDGHESTLKTQNALAECMIQKGLDEEALETLSDLIEKYKTTYGSNYDKQLEPLHAETNIAKIEFKAGRKEKALQGFQSVHTKYLKISEGAGSIYEGQFCLEYADALSEAGQFTEALNILENCMDRLEKVYGNKLWLVSLLLNKIGGTHFALRKFKEAFKFHSEAVQNGKAIFGENVSVLLYFKKSIAVDLLMLGKIKESMSLLNEIEDQMDASGKFHPLSNLPFVVALRKTGNNLEAIELLTRMKKSMSSMLAEKNQEMKQLSTEMNLIHEKLKIKEELKNICKFTLQKSISIPEAHLKLGELFKSHQMHFLENPDLFALYSLITARLSIQSGNFQRALIILQLCLNQTGACSMVNQKFAIDILLVKGDVYFGMKNYELALTNHKAAHERFSEIFGVLHVTTIQTKIRIATDLFLKGEDDEFFSMFSEIFETLQQLEDDGQTDLNLNALTYAMETFTTLFKDNSRSHQSLKDIKMMKENLELKVLTEQLNRAEDFVTRGSYETAYKVYKDVYQSADSQIWKEDIDEIASTCKNLGHVLIQLGKHEEALEILEGHLELVETNLGSEHHWAYLLRGSIANAQRGLGNFHEALNLHEGAYQGILNILDEGHAEVLVLRKEIAVDLSLLGKHEESICLFLDVLDKLGEILGNKHYHVIIANIEFSEAIERSNAGLHDALKILENVNKNLADGFDKECLFFQRVSKEISKINEKIAIESNK